MARDLEIDPTAIYQWIRGSVSPRPAKAILVIALVRPFGVLRLEEIYAQRNAAVMVARTESSERL